MPSKGEPTIYLTFDDGPHPKATSFVLAQLKSYNAKATFFCIGKNVAQNQELFQTILDSGHSVGNHTHDHLNGWKSTNENYIANFDLAAGIISSSAFRPPYGRISGTQANIIQSEPRRGKVFMWSILSGDFDKTISSDQCLRNVLKNIQPGSIVVFHDSEKAWEKLEFCLPQVLAFCVSKGWKLKGLT